MRHSAEGEKVMVTDQIDDQGSWRSDLMYGDWSTLRPTARRKGSVAYDWSWMEDNFLDQMLSFKYQVMPFGLSKHSSQFSGLCQQTHRREARCLCRSYIPVRHPDLYQGSRLAPPRGCTCRFHQDEVRFVGYVVSAEGVRPDKGQKDRASQDLVRAKASAR